MKIQTKIQGNIHIFYLSDNVMGGPDGTLLHDKLHQAQNEGATYAIIDLENVEFMNSSGLGMLISGMSTMRNGGGDLVLTKPSAKVQQLLQLTRLDAVFQQFPSVEEALASF